MHIFRVKLNLSSLFLLVIIFLLTLMPVIAQDDVAIELEIPDNVDGNLTIGQVGDTKIILADFAARVRYEQFIYYYFLDLFVTQNGESLIDLSNPENTFAPSLNQIIGLLVSDALPAQIYNLMLLSEIYVQEATARGITIDDCTLNTAWAQQLQLGEVVDCEADDLKNAITAYLQTAEHYSGLSIENIEAAFKANYLIVQVKEALQAEVDVPPLEAVRTRHIHVEDEALAQAIYERLQNGEDFNALLLDYSIDSGVQPSGGDMGSFGAGQVPPALEYAAFNAEIGAIVGPVSASDGFHVLEVSAKEFNIETRHILVESEASAYQILGLLENGADFTELAQQFSVDPGNGLNAASPNVVSPGQMAPAYEEAAFNAEEGEIVGPVQTDLGYYIIDIVNILDDVSLASARHILVETEDDARAIMERLEAGEDFTALAMERSIDPSAATNGGDLGTFRRGQMVPPFDEAVFSATVGEITGPVQTDFGFHVIEVTSLSLQPNLVTARQIVLETEEEALAVIARLEAGEDFSELAIALSTDPTAAGNGGDTLSIISQGQKMGLYPASEAATILEPVFEATVGDILEPISTGGSYLIVEVMEFGTVPASEEVVQQERDNYIAQWESERFASGDVMETGLWRLFMPAPILPSTVFESLASLDTYIEDATISQEEFRAKSTILNTLRGLQAPDIVQDADNN